MAHILFRYHTPKQSVSNKNTPPDFKKLLGESAWHKLHPAVQRRFADHSLRTTYSGALNINANIFGFIFAILLSPFGHPLPLYRRAKFDARVDVFPSPCGGVIWRREFLRPDKASLRVESVKQLSPKGHLLESVKSGPFGGIGMDLELYEHEGSLCFASTGYFFKIAKLHIPIPKWLTPGRTCVEHIDTQHLHGEGSFRFRMTMTHKWFGQTISQDGIFVDPYGSGC